MSLLFYRAPPWSGLHGIFLLWLVSLLSKTPLASCASLSFWESQLPSPFSPLHLPSSFGVLPSFLLSDSGGSVWLSSLRARRTDPLSSWSEAFIASIRARPYPLSCPIRGKARGSTTFVGHKSWTHPDEASEGDVIWPLAVWTCGKDAYAPTVMKRKNYVQESQKNQTMFSVSLSRSQTAFYPTSPCAVSNFLLQNLQKNNNIFSHKVSDFFWWTFQSGNYINWMLRSVTNISKYLQILFGWGLVMDT